MNLNIVEEKLKEIEEKQSLHLKRWGFENEELRQEEIKCYIKLYSFNLKKNITVMKDKLDLGDINDRQRYVSSIEAQLAASFTNLGFCENTRTHINVNNNNRYTRIDIGLPLDENELNRFSDFSIYLGRNEVGIPNFGSFNPNYSEAIRWRYIHASLAIQNFDIVLGLCEIACDAVLELYSIPVKQN